tara:strand:- start:7402 stop:7956 length:555 start_codon:yes stop_codon:yes gene_type:complete
MRKDYDGMGFALGTIRGFRRWAVTVNGELKSPFRSIGTALWLPGENVAKCQAHPSAEVVERKRDDEDFAGYYARVEEWRGSHDVTDCSHGFYAYFDGKEEDHRDPAVSGVIEGYGEVLIGTKGFRAMKARIVALAIKPHDGVWNLEPLIVSRLRANYPSIPVFDSEMVMRSEFPCPVYAESVTT